MKIIVLPDPKILYSLPEHTVIVGYETYDHVLGGVHQSVVPDIIVYTPSDCPTDIITTIRAHLPWAQFVQYDAVNPWLAVGCRCCTSNLL